jgi:hypothetical protein
LAQVAVYAALVGGGVAGAELVELLHGGCCRHVGSG